MACRVCVPTAHCRQVSELVAKANAELSAFTLSELAVLRAQLAASQQQQAHLGFVDGPHL